MATYTYMVKSMLLLLDSRLMIINKRDRRSVCVMCVHKIVWCVLCAVCCIIK
jgi:hypothetical protein